MRILRSPRWRRRLWPMPLIVVAVPLIYLGIHFSSPGNPGNATGPNVNEPGLAQPKNVPFTKAKQHEVSRVLRQFEATAVDRRDVASSWAISAPALREGVSQKDWNEGNLPVVPYPAADKGLGTWSFVQYSYPRTVGLEVFLFPKHGSGYSAMTADTELVKGSDGQWRVSYWMPKSFHGPPSVAKATVKAKAKPAKHTLPAKAAGKRSVPKTTRSAAPATASTGTPKVNRIWWILPLAVVALILLVPLGLGVGTWYRNRRAARQYAR